MTQKGTPFVYQGDEIGMTNFPFTAIDQFDDIEARNAWAAEVETGQVPAEDLPLAHEPHQPRPRPHPRAVGRQPVRRLHHRPPVVRRESQRRPDQRRRQAAPTRLDLPPLLPAIALRQRRPGARLRRLPRPRTPRIPASTPTPATIDGAGALVLLNFSRETLAYTPAVAPGPLLLGNLPDPSPDVLRGWEARVHALPASA